MDATIAGFVAQADAIATSGRWEAVNSAVERWAARPKTEDELWYGQVFSCFCYRVFTDYLALKAAYAATPPHEDLALLAWRARNLLELAVWTQFCTKERSNARQFFEDVGRDANNLLAEFGKWGEATDQAPDWFQSGNNARDGLTAKAQARGVASIGGKFTKVSDAAKEIGMEAHFTMMNKFLSKFAHPTAMFVVGNIESATLKDMILGNGCVSFVCAFTALENISKGRELTDVAMGSLLS